MVSSFVVFTDTTVGLRRAAPHRAAALDLPGGGLISRTAAGFRQGPRPPRRRGELIADATRRRVDGPLEVGQLGDDRRPEQLIVGRGDGADALGVGRPPGLERPGGCDQCASTGDGLSVHPLGSSRRHLANLWQTAVAGSRAHDRLGAGPGLTCWFGVESPPNRTGDPSLPWIGGPPWCYPPLRRWRRPRWRRRATTPSGAQGLTIPGRPRRTPS
jgi:hypothetical protein